MRTQRPLRLLQFNIMDGATEGRAAAVAAVIRASQADVVTLDEVNDEVAFKQIAAATGFRSRLVDAADGFNVAILSRFPIRQCRGYRQPPVRHAAYGCQIRVGSVDWWIFGAHLYPFDESVRATEIRFIIGQMKKRLPGPVVLAGDLNTDTPGETNGMGTLVVPLLRAAGYVDAFRELHSWQQDHGFTADTPAYGSWEQRVDYVFHSRAARPVAARVISSHDGTPWPSDHAALFVVLALRPAPAKR
jgi:endonuclease/exonuclease/phosphatase family metal-dependent hydrolase